MRKQIIVLIIMLLSIESFGQTSGLKRFFSPIPTPPINSNGLAEITAKNEWRPIIALPALRLVESTRTDSKIDALLLTSTGGGISWQKLKFDEVSDKWKSTFSFSPATILLSGNLSAENPIDISYAMTVGFLII